MNRKKRWLVCTACILTLVVATGAAIASSGWQLAAEPEKVAESSSESAGKKVRNVMLVKTAIVNDLSHPTATQTFVGQLVGRYNSKLAFRVAGKIAKRFVEVGQSVKAGDVLYELEPEDFDLQLATAVANEKAADAAVVQSQQEEDRMADLVRKNTVSKSEYDNVKLLLDSSVAKQTAAKKQTELAQRQKSYTRLCAEADGIVTAIRAEVGQVVTTAEAVLDVVRSDELEVEVNLPEQFTERQRMEYVNVSFWNRPNTKLMLRLREISPLADSNTRTFRARYSFVDAVQTPQRDGESWTVRDVPIKLGMTTNVYFGQTSDDGTLAIPATAVGHWNDKTVVWALKEFDPAVEKDSYAVEPVEIAYEQMDDQSVHVRAAAIANKIIVVAGVHKLTDESMVRRWKK